MTPEVRHFFYDLFFSMLVGEPSDQTIDAWRKGLAAVREAQSDGAVGKAAAGLLAILNVNDGNDAVRAEFGRLFLDPVEPGVSLLASQYVDGRPFGKYLVRLRTFLEKTPFRKRDDYSEPEDSLPFHLDLMRSFIREEEEISSSQDQAQWQALQRELVNDYIGTWIDRPISELEKRDTEPFYRQVAFLLRLYFQQEREFLLQPQGK